MCSDLLEASGYEIFFAAGGVANDELLSEIGQRRPDAVVVFAASASDAPKIRGLIDTVRSRQANPGMPIICGGGVFARAPGLAEEMGADATADDPFAVERMIRGALASPQTRAAPVAVPTVSLRRRAAVA